MDIELFREKCLALPYVTEDMPFDDTVVVFRLKGKIFGCITLDNHDLVVLKCDPDRAIALRDAYHGICGAWHWNKRYWNEVHFDCDVPDALIYELIAHSLDEVLRKLPKKTQREYAELLAAR